MTDYKPIACQIYDRYEIAILRHAKLRLVWHEDNVIYDRIVNPLNLETRQGEEFLVFATSEGEMRCARLDLITRADPQ
jgi:transcriptional antiterminator Rof (Rho-off)